MFITDWCIVVFCDDPMPGGQVTWDTRMLDKYNATTNTRLYFVF